MLSFDSIVSQSDNKIFIDFFHKSKLEYKHEIVEIEYHLYGKRTFYTTQQSILIIIRYLSGSFSEK